MTCVENWENKSEHVLAPQKMKKLFHFLWKSVGSPSYNMKVKTLPLIFLAFSLALVSKAKATTAEHGPSPEILPEASAETIEIARVRLQNIKSGIIEGSRDAGQTWTPIGHVLQPVIKVNRKGYNASKYGPVGTVVATAVNAIHLKAGNNVPENRGVIWSLAPMAETQAGKNSLQSEVSPQSAAFTDIPGGSGLFGGPFTPFVGNPIFLDNDRNNILTPLPDNYIPKLGESWVIEVRRPRRYPREIVFENRFGGLITLQYRGEEPKVIGQVLRPVLGIGRFVGSYFSEVGRLRANHNGVIDISTSPHGVVGSFQIVPANHAMSAETHYIRELTQWMVVGPVSALDPSPEGAAPLFSQFLRPRYDVSDISDPDPIEGLAGRFYFDVKKYGKADFQPMPTFWVQANKPLPTWANTALADVEKIRIVFPFVWDDVPKVAPTATMSVAPVVASSTTSEVDAAETGDK
ncbi:hypothetical protein B1R32_104143 [Abditibacterium utsteinense]|uniref:Uncharacterized protein n=1 Tax=Abditibacterium utsteinense TaxID=1960156 RepID=A0A2S8SV44_9BACT|nr:hypothetical protein [Abditibacterium utsteinense]PQV64649.1 hypothetical protein B1R32_104143 [Abditibacterium utsteinense]